MAEEFYPVPENPEYNAAAIRKIQDTDPVQASTIINPVVQQMISNTHAVKKQADQNDQNFRTMTTEVYNPEATYNAGAYCIHNGKLYKAQVNISEPEAWTESHWIVTSVGEELQELDAALSNKADRKLSNLETPQLALANLGAGVRPNLLDNAFFRVNQRGNAAYQAPSSTIYACDRFKISHGTVTSLENGVEVSAADENVYFIQYFEQAFDTFAGQELTISALTPNGLFAASGLVPEPEPSGNQVYFRVNLGNGWELSLEYGGVSKRLIWAVRASAGLPSAPLQILAAKAEFGPAQTLAYQDDDGAWQLLPQSDMDYGTQLFRCQRYQIPLDGTSRYPIVQIVDANTLLIFIPLPVTMRTAPALSDPDGKLIIYDQIGAAQTGFAFDVAAFCSNGIMLRAQKVNHGITGGFLYVNATTGVDAPFLVANL